MRILIILCLLPVTLLAQQPPEEYPFRFQVFGAAAAPLFSTGKHFNNNNLFGQATFAGGGGYMMSYRVRKNFHIGIVFHMLMYTLHEEATRQQAYERYSKSGFYTGISEVNRNYSIATLNVEVAYRKYNPIVETEPFVRIGFASMELQQPTTVTTKQANTNYSETTSLWQAAPETFSPSLNAGVRFFKKINNRAGIAASAHYTYSSYNLDMREDITNHLNERYPLYKVKIKQAVHAIQYEIGLQFRFYKKPKAATEVNSNDQI